MNPTIYSEYCSNPSIVFNAALGNNIERLKHFTVSMRLEKELYNELGLETLELIGVTT